MIPRTVQPQRLRGNGLHRHDSMKIGVAVLPRRGLNFTREHISQDPARLARFSGDGVGARRR